MAVLDDVIKDLKARIDKTMDDLRRDFGRIRTGRANLSILDGIR
jgi:ribosome recycling factor